MSGDVWMRLQAALQYACKETRRELGIAHDHGKYKIIERDSTGDIIDVSDWGSIDEAKQCLRDIINNRNKV